MTPTIKVDGLDFPVTQRWYDQVIKPYPDLAILNLDGLMLERDRLLGLSNSRLRPLGQPRPIFDQQRLAMVTHVINVHRATRWFEGRNLEEIGFEGVDQLHGNTCRHACGCETQEVFDHHKMFAQATAADILKDQANGIEHFGRKAAWVHASAISGHHPTDGLNDAAAWEITTQPHDPARVCEKHAPFLPLGLNTFHKKVHEDNFVPDSEA